jgi:hypothetical protein
MIKYKIWGIFFVYNIAIENFHTNYAYGFTK